MTQSPPEISLLTEFKRAPEIRSDTASSQGMQAMIKLRIAVSRLKTDPGTRNFQERCTHDYDRPVGNNPEFKPNDNVYIDNLALRSTVHSNAEVISKKAHNKLEPRTAEPFRIITLHEKTLTRKEKTLPPTICIVRVTRAPETNS